MFIEHVAAADRPRRLLWQDRLEPVWKLLAGNCHLTRRTEENIISAGFKLLDVQWASMRKAPHRPSDRARHRPPPGRLNLRGPASSVATDDGTYV